MSTLTFSIKVNGILANLVVCLFLFTADAAGNQDRPMSTRPLNYTAASRPVSVRMRGKDRAMSANDTYRVECEIVGANPAPVVSWWKDNTNISNNTAVRASPDGNVTVSILKFRPDEMDNGKHLSCRVHHPLSLDSDLEDGRKLLVYRPIARVHVVLGGVVRLPCVITLPEANPSLVIWFKGERDLPIYSYDVRKDTWKGSHWTNKDLLGNRVEFLPYTKPAYLKIKNVTETDAGLYRCRADYDGHPTRNQEINLTIIVPVEKVAILNKDGKHIRNYKLGPFNEGESVSIRCLATGGDPPPEVTWWSDDTLLDNSSALLPGRRVENILQLNSLSRTHLKKVFTCRANNSAQYTPLSSAVMLQLNLRPLWVRLKGENRPLSANHTYELECQVVGSVPSPLVSWWKGSSNVSHSSTTTTSTDGNTTISVLKFRPEVLDGGKYLSCRGQQPLIPDSGLEDGWKLVVYHIPILSLELGSVVNYTVIREGMDVYFECNIKSNPWVYQIRWLYNGQQLFNNMAEGVLVSNQSLVLQSVTRTHSGTYTCVASNREGDGESNPVYLDVKFAPTCRPGQMTEYEVGRGEIARIRCEVEANPTQLNYTWRVDTGNGAHEVPREHMQNEGGRSVLRYLPRTEGDFGVLYCWGQNNVGVQTEPCQYRLIPAGIPDKLTNCSLTNLTSMSFIIECSEAYDGGLPQEFMIEVFNENQKLVNTIINRTPNFRVTGLDGGKLYKLRMFAFNKKGKSTPIVFRERTLESPKRRTAYLHELLDLKSWTGLLVCGAAALTACLIVTAVTLCRRIACARKENERPSEPPINPACIHNVFDNRNEFNPDTLSFERQLTPGQLHYQRC